MRYGLIFLILCAFYCTNLAQNKSFKLNSEWQFKSSDASEWLPAKVPGNVYLDLLNSKKIKDPYYADQVNESRWVEKKNWEYKTQISCTKEILSQQHVELIFGGLDTHASVYLNDSLILKSNNMFRSYTVDVKKHLKQGLNTLQIMFESSVLYGQKEAAKLSYVLPEEERIFSRKAQFQFGWDFAPRFVGCGIWKPITMAVWNDTKINSVQQITSSLTQTNATVYFIVETYCKTPGDYQLEIVNKTQAPTNAVSTRQEQTLKLKAGINYDTLKFSIQNPQLWWCNGMGEAYLYDFLISLNHKKKSLQNYPIQVGLRTLELVKESDEQGVSFYFKLNDVPVFMKGANYVPDDIFLTKKTKEAIRSEIDLAKKAHMNMLRIWGGGVYPDDEFYEACDKSGILIWQDLMFACAMYPGDSAFVKNVREEVKEQIIRLRNHPSLALWCGNNEIDEAWKNWGWQKQFKYTSNDSSKIWKDYEHLFFTEVPKLMQTYHADATYWPSSPSIGWGHKESLTRGDSHYWGVWWGMEPFEMYQKKSGRFMTEYGFQSLPALSSIRKFCPDSQLNLNSAAIKMHQKHPKGYQTIQNYLERSYKTPKSFEAYIYVSQLLQRDGLKMAIETHRRNKPVCMGTLFWQMNDCWPMTSWSAVDYYKQPKAIYFALNDLYKTQAISITHNKNQILVYVISDSLVNTGARITVKLFNFKSELLWQKNYPTVLTNNRVSILKIPMDELGYFDTLQTFVKVELNSMGKRLASNYYFFTLQKFISLPQAYIQVIRLDSNTLEVSSNVFAKDVYLYDEKQEFLFSDNFFNLEVGQKKQIKLLNSNSELPINSIKRFVLNNL